MARRKNVKRIDPRYFLHETVNRDAEVLEEGFEHPKPASGRFSSSKAGSWSRKDVANKAAGRWLKETDEEKEPGVGGQPPKWERELAKSDPTGPTARSKRRHVRGLEDPDVDVEKLEEGCPHAEEGGEAIDISAPGMEVHVDDISQLSPEEAFAAGMAAARDAIDQVMGGPDGPPPEGGFSGPGPYGEPAAEEE